MERDVIDQGGQDGPRVHTGEAADAIWPDASRVVESRDGSRLWVTVADGRQIEILNGRVYDPDDYAGHQLGLPLE